MTHTHHENGTKKSRKALFIIPTLGILTTTHKQSNLNKLRGAAEARRAHNPEVTRSKRVAARNLVVLLRFFFLEPSYRWTFVCLFSYRPPPCLYFFLSFWWGVLRRVEREVRGQCGQGVVLSFSVAFGMIQWSSPSYSSFLSPFSPFLLPMFRSTHPRLPFLFLL